MVLEVPANTGEVVTHLDPGRAQVIGGTDTGDHEQLRRVDRAGGEDDLTLCMRSHEGAGPNVLDTEGAPSLEENAHRMGAGDDGEIGAPHRRAQIRGCGARARAARLRHLRVVDAVPAFWR